MSVNLFGTSKESKNCWDHALIVTEFCYLLSVLFKIADNIPPSNPRNPTRESNFQIRTIVV